MSILLKSKIIYIIRHGETDYNRQQMVQGRGIDSSLNERGRAQAERFFEAYKHVKFDKIYTSALKRTHQTVERFVNLGIPTEGHSGFDEISWGQHEGLRYDSDRHQEYLMGLEAWRKGNLDHRVAQGESPNELVIRQKEAIKYIMDQPGDTLLVATHGRAMRFLVCWMMGKELTEADEYEHSNLCLYQMSYDGHKCEMIISNDTSHLTGMPA